MTSHTDHFVKARAAARRAGSTKIPTTTISRAETMK
jgi:hypothetical protein